MASARVGGTAGARGQACVLAAAVLCLLLVKDVLFAADPVFGGDADQIPFVVALFVVPVLFVFPGCRSLLVRRRWLVLAVQGVLTWVPFAVFGGHWQVGVGGLLAGLVLLTVSGWVSWLAAAALLAADVAVRAGIVGLPTSFGPGWAGAVWAAVAFTDLGFASFGMVRLAQLVGELGEAQDRHAELAVARERLTAAEDLQAAVGERLDGIAAAATAARLALAGDPVGARAQISRAGQAAREAVAQARAVVTSRPGLPGPGPAAGPAAGRGGGAVIGTRLAWAVLVVVLCGYAVAGMLDAVAGHIGARLTALVATGAAVVMVLQLRHSWAARQGRRPRGWPLTLGLQAVVVYAFFLPPAGTLFTLAPFLAGSALLLLRGWWRWAGYAAVLVSWPALYATVTLSGITAGDRNALTTLYEAGSIAAAGMLVAGLSWLAGRARDLAELRDQLTGMAAEGERLRVARDVHDLLGLGLSAIALKTDLIARLIGRDDRRAGAEIEELNRICAAARADARLVIGDGARLSLAGEVDAARQILAVAGVRVQVNIPVGPLPREADDVLAPVLREAVTNILRHSAAKTAVIEVAAAAGSIELAVSNDAAAADGAAGDGAAGDGAVGDGTPTGFGGAGAVDSGDGRAAGRGLANLTARVAAAGGEMTSRRRDGRFELTARIPLAGPVTPVTPAAPVGRRDLPPGRSAADR
jgi:two-component system, NarL family, sensor histidine kinase DesK